MPAPAAADATSQDWEDWEGLNVADLDDSSEVAELREAVIERRRLRGGRRRNVRDEYIRPIVDAQVRQPALQHDDAGGAGRAVDVPRLAWLGRLKCRHATTCSRGGA